MSEETDYKQAFANMQHGAFVVSGGMSGMQDFSIQIMRHVLGGGALDDNALATIKETCIRNIKNLDVSGMSIQQEAVAGGQIVQLLNQLMDFAILKGREVD